MLGMGKWKAGYAGVSHISEGRDKGDFIGFIIATTQFLSALAACKPLIALAVQGIVKYLVKMKKPGILRRMTGYTGRNCKLRTLAYTVTDSIIDVIQNKPGGYVFWQSLPKRGRNNPDAIRKVVADTLLESLYDSSFMEMLVRAALDENGKPLTHSPLYKWLLTQVYSDNTAKLYSDWLKVCKK